MKTYALFFSLCPPIEENLFQFFFSVFVIKNLVLAFFPQLSKPEKVAIPERYVELEPEEPLSTEELAARQRKAEKIKNILTKSRSGFFHILYRGWC